MIGKNMKHAMEYYARNEIWGFAPFWSGYAHKDRATINAIESLVKQGYLEVNKYHMAHATSKGLRLVLKLGLV